MVLITGDLGFVGTNLKKILDPNTYRGYDIRNGDDILDRDRLKEAMTGCDTLVHLAALISVPKSFEHPVAYYNNNIIGTATVLEVAKEVGVKRIIFASSAATYQGSSSPYAISKLTGEVVLGTGRTNQTIINLRFFNIYGIGQNPEYAGVITRFAEDCKKGKISIYGDGSQTRDFVHVLDVAKAIKLAIDAPIEGVLYADIGTGKSVSIKELAYLVKGIAGSSAEIEYLPEKQEVKHSTADIQNAKKYLNFEASVSLIDGLTDFLFEPTKLSVPRHKGSKPK